MYFVAVVETWFSKDGQTASGIPLTNRRLAATWAFAGIVLTLGVGVFAGESGRSDTPKLIVPFVCIAYWAYYHWRVSALIDFGLIQDQLTKVYNDAVLEVLKLAVNPLTASEVFERIIRDVDSGSPAHAGGSQLARRVAPVPLRAIVDTLMFTPAKVTTILNDLVSQGLASRQYGSAGSETTYFLKSREQGI